MTYIDRQVKLISMLCSDWHTLSEIAQSLSIHQRSVYRYIDSLHREGFIIELKDINASGKRTGVKSRKKPGVIQYRIEIIPESLDNAIKKYYNRNETKGQSPEYSNIRSGAKVFVGA